MSHPVIERLRSSDPEARRAACAAAAQDPAAVLLCEALSAALADPARAVARAAGDALVAIGRRDRGVEALLRGTLRSDSPARRIGAAFALARLVPPGPALLPALVEALASPEGDVRWAAARVLVDMGRLHGEVLGVVLALARPGAAPGVRRMAGFCLRELAPDRPEAARVLLEATRDREPGLRRAALSALASLVDPPPEVPARLLEVLGADADPPARRIAALALGELGAAAHAALPEAAREGLRSAREQAADPGLRRAAERALARLEEAGAR